MTSPHPSTVDCRPGIAVETEQAVLGLILAHNWLITDIRSISRSEDFGDPLHQRLFAAFVEIADTAPELISISNIYQRFASDDGLAAVGGLEYLRCLLLNAPSNFNLAALTANLKQNAKLRGLADIGMRLCETAASCATDAADDVVRSVQSELERLEREYSQTTSGYEIQSSSAFIGDFIPPDYLWDGILQRRFIYTLTAQTGVGKTAIALRLAAHVALGEPLAGRDVGIGKVLFLAGENPDDLRARWVALSEAMNFSSENVPVFFYPATFHVPSRMTQLKAFAEREGGIALVITDTAAAFFFGDDENANTDAGSHARELRALTTLKGQPTTLVLAHPVKGASDTNLIPRGGGAFLNEVDGNLTAVKKPRGAIVHWEGKFRGPDFAAVPFALEGAFSEKLRDSRGRLVPTVIARPISDLEQTALEDAEDDDVLTILAAMIAHPGISMAKLGEAAGWSDGTGKVDKSRVQRVIKRMADQKLVEKVLNTWVVTSKGKNAAKGQEARG